MQHFPSQWNQSLPLPLSWDKSGIQFQNITLPQQQHNISISNNIYDKISAKSKDFDEAKNIIKARIRENCETAIEKIRAIETTLFKEVEDEFSEDPFGLLLERINSGYVPTDDEINVTLSMEIPHDFGPDEEMFFDLYKEIESFKGWKKTKSDKLAKSIADAQNRSALSDCTWKECPDDVSSGKKYSLDANNFRIATKTSDSYFYCTIIGNIPLPLNQVTSWSIKIIKSKKNDGDDIYIGVAPSDISQNDDNNYRKCGWYFDCYNSSLCSGPPHKYGWNTEYGPRKEKGGEYVHTGDTVGVIMDTTTKGELSFVLDGVNRGVAYEGIPLDRPLVPCVLLKQGGDSIGLDTSEVKEDEKDNSIPIPSNIMTRIVTWDTITLTWDKVEGATSYQIELDGNKTLNSSTSNIFTKIDLIPDTEHTFRVRATRGNSVGKWSYALKGRTKGVPVPTGVFIRYVTYDTINITWNAVEGALRYLVEIDGNNYKSITINSFTLYGLFPGTNHHFKVCTIINDSMSKWSDVVKVRTKEIPIPAGVFISDVTCNTITLAWNAIEGIPLFQIELNGCRLFDENSTTTTFRELQPSTEYSFRVRAMISNSMSKWSDVVKGRTKDIPIPTDIFLSKVTCDAITLEWDTAEGASGYKIEVDGNKIVDESSTVFTLESIPPNSEHSFRVCAVVNNSMSKWSDIVRGRTKELRVPTNFTVNHVTCSTITLAWDAVEGAEFYKVELDEDILVDENSTTTTFRELQPDTEYSFRVRAAVGNLMSGWSDVVKGRTKDIPIPTGVLMNDTTYNTITLAWDAVEGAEFYKVELDEVILFDENSTITTFRELQPSTEYSFRVSAAVGNLMSGWSDVVKGRTKKWDCAWKECPDDLSFKYSVEENNSRIASNTNCWNYCTIIGDTPLPPNKVTSWTIKILKSENNNGKGIYIGIAPFDIDLDVCNNYEKCGWYFYCYDSTLISGPPHKYSDKKYSPRKKGDGEYVLTGGSVGVVMDMSKGELSFVLDGVNLSIAFKKIPLDKPLMPCVHLEKRNDSVELIT